VQCAALQLTARSVGPTDENVTLLRKYDVESLCEAVQNGSEPKYLFFWGHTAKRRRGVGKECLSQWYPSPFVLNGKTFRTAEHFMMFRKAVLFGDDECADQILAAPSPGAAKALGRSVRGFEEDLWLEHRFEIVVEANREKFSQSRALSEFLFKTGGKVLVEASPTDTVWGIGLAAEDTRASNPALWRGLNLLGFALMVVRDQGQ